MAYNEKLADRVREALAGKKNLLEKRMFGGIAFMINEKMWVGVDKDDIMLRCDPERMEELLALKGGKPFDLTGRPMKGWLLIGPEGTKSKKDFDWWINTDLEANKKAAGVKKKKG